MANGFSGFSGTPDQGNFLQNLGQLLLLMQGASQNQPLQTLSALQQMQVTKAKLGEYQRQQRAAQQQAALRTQAGQMLAGDLGPGQLGPPAPLDVNRFMALASHDPEIMKLLTPQSIELLQQGGRIPDFGALQAQTALSQEKALRTFPGPPPGYSQELSGAPTGVTFKRKQPTGLEEMQTGAIRELAKTPREQLGMVTEAKRPPISEENLNQKIEQGIGRVREIDKLLIGAGGAGDRKAQLMSFAYGPAQGIEKLRLKIERNLLAASTQDDENRRAEIARSQGFPEQQPRRLFSIPGLDKRSLVEGAVREFLLNYGIEWPERPKPVRLGASVVPESAKPDVPPDVATALEQFLREEFGATQ